MTRAISDGQGASSDSPADGLEFNLMDPDLLIYVVAVDCSPVVWQVNCEICDELVDEPTTHGDLIDSRELKHRQFHGFSEDDSAESVGDDGAMIASYR